MSGGFMGKKFLTNVLLIIFGVVAGLLFAELAVRVFYPQDRMVTWLEMHPSGFMMNQSGGNAFQEHGERRAKYKFTKNRLRGFGNSGTEQAILAIGDSFTFGLLLNEQDTFVNHLQTKMEAAQKNSARILNGGVGGAGLADWPAWLAAFGDKIKPGLVIYFFNIHDLDRALSKNLYVLQRDSLLKTQRWQPREFMFRLGQKRWYRWFQAHSDLANLIVKVFWKNFYFIDLTDDFNPQNTSVPIPKESDFLLSSDYSLELGKLLIGKMQAWCSDNNCELIVTTTGFFDKESQPNHTTKLYEWLLEHHASSASELNFFDNTECVQNKAAENLETIQIPNDSHPDEKGAAIIAECTWSWLDSAK